MHFRRNIRRHAETNGYKFVESFWRIINLFSHNYISFKSKARKCLYFVNISVFMKIIAVTKYLNS